MGDPVSGEARRRLRCALVRAAALLALVGAWGCQDDPPAPAEAKSEPVAEKKPAVDQKIANAMAAAEATARSEQAGGAQDAQTAPPPDGILTPEAAARELAPGSPAQLVLGSPGGTPRSRLGPEQLQAGAGPAGKLVLSYRAGGSVMPTVELELKPRVSAAGAETQPASVPAASGSAGSNLGLSFLIGAARPAAEQPGRLPDNATAEIAKLNGSSIDLVITRSGARIAQRQKLAGNNPDLEPFVTGSAEALSSVVLQYPDVPVGSGAFWMIKSRETANGANVLAYRMVKLTELTPDAARLSVSTRRYLFEPSLSMRGLPPHRVRRFESQGEATLSLKPGSLYPDSAESHDTFMALVTPDARANQAVPVQAELTARLTFSR